jgi:flagellar biosynthesis protein FlhF
MRSPARSAFDPKSTELNFFFSHNAEQPRSRGLIDA